VFFGAWPASARLLASERWLELAAAFERPVMMLNSEVPRLT
jgi:hypothetical protein